MKLLNKFILILFIIVISSCGNKGDLYIPESSDNAMNINTGV